MTDGKNGQSLHCGHALKSFRTVIGISGKEMSQMAGVSVSMISAIERGQWSVTESFREKFLRAFFVYLPTLHWAMLQMEQPTTRPMQEAAKLIHFEYFKIAGHWRQWMINKERNQLPSDYQQLIREL